MFTPVLFAAVILALPDESSCYCQGPSVSCCEYLDPGGPYLGPLNCPCSLPVIIDDGGYSIAVPCDPPGYRLDEDFWSTTRTCSYLFPVCILSQHPCQYEEEPTYVGNGCASRFLLPLTEFTCFGNSEG